MSDARKALDEGQRPIWMPEEVAYELARIWNSVDYKQKQAQNKMNRASTKGGSLHTCGSIPVSEHKRRMREATGKEPSLSEIFLKTHKKKDTNDFVDQRSADVVAEYNRIALTRSSQASADDITDEIPTEEQNAMWLEVVGGKNKKGRIFGGGSETPEICSSSSETCAASQSWLHPQVEQEIDRRLARATEESNAAIKQLREEQAAYKKEIEELKRLIIVPTNQDQDGDED